MMASNEDRFTSTLNLWVCEGARRTFVSERFLTRAIFHVNGKAPFNDSGLSNTLDNSGNFDDDPETHPSDGIVTTRVLTDERTSELIPPHSQRLTTKDGDPEALPLVEAVPTKEPDSDGNDSAKQNTILSLSSSQINADQNSGVTFQKAKQILQSFETEVAETIFSDNVRCQCEVVEAILSCFPDEARRLDVTPVYQLPPLLNSLERQAIVSFGISTRLIADVVGLAFETLPNKETAEKSKVFHYLMALDATLGIFQFGLQGDEEHVLYTRLVIGYFIMKLADTGLSQLADTLIIERTIRMLSYAVPYLHTTLCADCMQALPLPKATNKTDCLSSQPDISVDAVCARIKSIKVSQMTPLNAALLSSKVSKLLRCVRGLQGDCRVFEGDIIRITDDKGFSFTPPAINSTRGKIAISFNTTYPTNTTLLSSRCRDVLKQLKNQAFSQANSVRITEASRQFWSSAWRDVNVSSLTDYPRFLKSRLSFCTSTCHHLGADMVRLIGSLDSLKRKLEKVELPTEKTLIAAQVEAQVALCKCADRIRVKKIEDLKYMFGSSIMMLMRVTGRTVMVRVGGGWVELSEFLEKRDPCRRR